MPITQQTYFYARLQSQCHNGWKPPLSAPQSNFWKTLASSLPWYLYASPFLGLKTRVSCWSLPPNQYLGHITAHIQCLIEWLKCYWLLYRMCLLITDFFGAYLYKELPAYILTETYTNHEWYFCPDEYDLGLLGVSPHLMFLPCLIWK